MNSIVISGRLTRDVELRYTSNTNKEVANFTVAVNRRFEKDKADFINCTAWGKTADIISKHFSKGKMITVHGEMRIDTFDKDDGSKGYKSYVNVDNFSFCGDSKSNEDTENDNPFVEVPGSELPF